MSQTSVLAKVDSVDYSIDCAILQVGQLPLVIVGNCFPNSHTHSNPSVNGCQCCAFLNKLDREGSVMR